MLHNLVERFKTQHQERKYSEKLLIELAKSLRPSTWKSSQYTIERFQALLNFLETDTDFRNALKKHIEEICLANNPLVLLTDVGVMGSKGFVAELSERISYKILPPLMPPYELRTTLDEIFHKKNDFEWVWAIPNDLWAKFVKILDLFADAKIQEYWLNEMLNAIVVLSQRVTALGLEPEIIAKLPDMDDLTSPFLTLSREITHFVENYKNNVAYRNQNEEDYKHILVMIRQCEESINRLNKDKNKYGVGLRITYFILRLTQNIERLKVILHLLKATQSERKISIGVDLFKEMVFAENKKYSVRKHLSDNLGFLAYKVVEHTSKTGEHYITSNRKEYVKLFLYALGGGFIVAFLCIFKARIGNQHFAPFWEAFLFAMNYSLGFILIHILHFTLATKQPAMTASTIAQTLGSWQEENPHHRSRDKKLQEVAPLIARLVRSQFISLVGNVVMVFPVAYGLTLGYEYFFDDSVVEVTKAQKMIAELQPFTSAALPHAAIAGIFLMTSGLIAGYYDNKVVYDNIPERMRRYSFLRKILPKRVFLRLVDYLEKNLGALAGNFYLGLFLGFMGNIGKILGLNLDIRHITFAAGNFALALFTLKNEVEIATILYTILGIFLIGMVNVTVSFGLSVVVALKSRNITFTETRRLTLFILKTFWKNPWQFLFPFENKKQENIKHEVK
jgi:site-specific recombinase